MSARVGLKRREAGANALASGPSRGDHARILRAILRRKAGDLFTSEDLRKKLPTVNCPNAWGAAFLTAKRGGHIEADRFCRATLPSSHARILVVWRRR